MKDNALRCIAAEIIVKLYEKKNTNQLILLREQINASIKTLQAQELEQER